MRIGRAGAIASAAGLALLAACGGGDRTGGGGAEETPAGNHDTFGGGPPGGTLVVLSDREPDDLNPLTFDSSPAYQLVHLLFRALARRDSTLSTYHPDFLAEWRMEDSATVWMRVRPDLRWHDGTPVSAEDVRFTLERQKDPGVASPRQGDVAAVSAVEVVDSVTLRVRLSATGPSTVNALLEVIPVPAHLLDSIPPERMRFSGFGRRPVGNGLFRFEGWQANQQVTVVADTAAPDGRPSLDRIVVRNVPEANARVTALLSGEGDMAKITAEERAQVENSSGVTLHHAKRVRPTWIAWNVDRAPVNDPAVRRAFVMALDRPGLARAFLGEEGEAAFTVLPPSLWEHSADVRGLAHDPAGAARLLEQAGWRDADGDSIREKDGRPLRVEIEYNSSDAIRRDFLVAMQQQLRQAGIDMAPRPYESTAWVERLRAREFVGSFWGWGWGPGVMGPNAAMLFHSRSIPPGGPNFAGYRNPRVDGWIDSVLVTRDTAASRRLWRGIEQAVTDDAPYAPIYLDPEYYGVSDRFRNVAFRGPEWWEDVIYWYVPENRRTPRDRAGTGG